MSRTNGWLTVALAASLACELHAQTTTSGGLNGVVTDQTYAVVPDAKVVITDSTRGLSQSQKTDHEGVYRFSFLAPGRYALSVSHAGFQEEKRVVNVLLGPPVSVNVALEVAKTHDVITVSSEAPLIQAENGDVSATVGTRQISEEPNPGNDLTNIVQITPGVTMNTDNNFSSAFSILGMPGTSNLFTINGMDENDNASNQQLVGSVFLLLGQNQIEEATVVTTGYSGQFGGAAGANINYVTKSGTSEFHGNAQWYWNGRILNANDWFIKATGGQRPFNVANQWAGSIGGPIKKDKLFFFFDNEGLRVLYPQTVPVQVPSPEFETATLAHIATDSRFGPSSATYSFYRRIFDLYNGAPGLNFAKSGALGDPLGCSGFRDKNSGLGITVPCARYVIQARARPSQDMLNSGRFDWNISARDHVSLRVQYDSGHSSISTDSISPLFDADLRAPKWQGQIMETHAFGSSGGNQFLLAGSSLMAFFEAIHSAQALSAFPTHLSFSAHGTFTDLGNSEFNPKQIYGVPLRYQLTDDLAKTWHNHKVGFGANLEVIHWDFWEYSFNMIGTLNPQTLDAFFQGGVDPVYVASLHGGAPDPNPDFTTLNQSFPTALSERMNFLNFATYGQDEWHARRNLSLTFALRAEHQSNPSCERRCFARFAGPFDSISHDPNQPYNQALITNQKQALVAMDKILWSPRFSFAWQPFGTAHGTVLRGGIGVFYDPLPGLLTQMSGNPPLFNSFTVSGDNLAPGETTNVFKDAAASNAAFLNGFNSGQTLAQIQAAVSAVSPTGFSPPYTTVPDGLTHSPQYQRWSLQLQQTLGVHSLVNVGYFGYHGIHGLVLNPSANAWGFGTLPKSLCASPPVPPCADPRFSQITTVTSGAISNYHGMVASFQHRFSHWTPGLFQVNYTFGHALDEVSNGGLFGYTGTSTLSAQDPKNLRRNYGPAEYDVRHSLNANYVWELPIRTLLRGHGANSLVSGWQISGTMLFHLGYPQSIFDYFESGILQQKNFFGPIYAVPVAPFGPDPPCGKGAAFTNPVRPCEPPQLLADGVTPNPYARFVQSGCETGFDAGKLGSFPNCLNGTTTISFRQSRNRFRGPGYFNTDFTIMKNTRFPGLENVSLGIGLQFFNFFNHPNFNDPVNGISDAGFGLIGGLDGSYTSIFGNQTGADASRRVIQLKAQFQF
jgi:Carboxypeptidase regulatory-like domain/TonB-dependent Receptor Plug Domain